MARGSLFHHPASGLAHDTGRGHPERPERIAAIEEDLAAHDWLGWDVRESPRATDAQLELVHPAAHLARIGRLCAAGGGAIDADTVLSPGSDEAARRAAGGAVALVDALLSADGPRTGASVHRPPGHHAEPDRAMGFCLYNAMAVAARRATDHHGLQRVLVLDWDVHHGNGTAAAFAADPRVAFVSIHESPLYPGTGAARDVGSGEGVGTTVNVPVPAGSGDAVFCSVVEHVVVPLGRAWAPQLVLVSAGFDAHRDDPLAGCAVSDEGYAAMTGSVRRLADALGVPLGIVLEGGYELGALTRGLRTTLTVSGADAAPPADPDLAVHPLAAAARDRVGAFFPALA